MKILNTTLRPAHETAGTHSTVAKNAVKYTNNKLNGAVMKNVRQLIIALLIIKGENNFTTKSNNKTILFRPSSSSLEQSDIEKSKPISGSQKRKPVVTLRAEQGDLYLLRTVTVTISNVLKCFSN